MTHPDVRSVWHGDKRRGRRGRHPHPPIGLSRSRSSLPLLRHAVEPRGAQLDEGVEPRRHVPSLRVPRGCVGCVEEGAGREKLLGLWTPSAGGAGGSEGGRMYLPVSHYEDTASPPREKRARSCGSLIAFGWDVPSSSLSQNVPDLGTHPFQVEERECSSTGMFSFHRWSVCFPAVESVTPL